MPVQRRPCQPEHGHRPAPATPARQPAGASGDRHRRAPPQRQQHRQLHAGQRAQHQPCGTAPTEQVWSGSFGNNPCSLQSVTTACLSGNAPRGCQRRTVPRWKLTRKLAPPPVASPTLTEPPWCCTISFTSCRPRPLPLPAARSRWNGSKIASRSLTGMPAP
ncbi:hypothetical protein G6F46_014153 [Rhizopus delemar]|nr:hypothetical protein G6F46_014153 [Rhizopus delemar]